MPSYPKVMPIRIPPKHLEVSPQRLPEAGALEVPRFHQEAKKYLKTLLYQDQGF